MNGTASTRRGGSVRRSDDSSTETETAPAVDDSHSPSMSAGAEAAGLGIIGGADGPTVMVTTAA